MEPFIVKDIWAGSSSSSPTSLTNVNATLYFTASDNINGTELWKSDGTAAGTTLVKDIWPGTYGYAPSSPNSSTPNNLTNVNGTLYFAANAPNIGQELWKSDGTAAGTTLVKDINPGRYGSSRPNSLTNINGTFYFVADGDDRIGPELWKSDGTAAGTTLVKDIWPGPTGSGPRNLINVNGTFYFIADNGQRVGIWKSDGTAAGTTPIKNSSTGSGFYGLGNLTDFNGTFYFTARDDSGNGDGLWKSDGTAAGATLVKGINIASDRFGNLTNINGTLYFTVVTTFGHSASDGFARCELWKSDGTAAGTTLVKNINKSDRFGFNLTNVNGTLYFTADDGISGTELWKSDGTAAGTTLVKNINLGSNSSSPSKLTNVSGTLYFTANDGTNGQELWRSDGTAAGTTLVKNINPGSSGSDPQNLININEILYFTATDAINGTELWKLDTSSKNQNNVPIVTNVITDQTAIEDKAFTFQFDANAFSDSDVGDTLSYSAALENNNPLPSWLTFDAATRTFSGTPTTYSDLGNLSVEVTATDNLGANVSYVFGLSIAPRGSTNFTGSLVTQIDPAVNFDWGQSEPTPGIEADTFAVRWTGQVQAQYSELHTFYTQSDDGVRLWVNDQLLIDNWTEHALTENSATISLVAGQKYNINMEFYDNAVNATAKLLWSSASTAKAVIPQSQLYSDASQKGDGLQAVYYANLDFTGASAAQVDATVNFNWSGNFDWSGGTATPGIEADTFSVRWTGQVQPQYSEDYTFYTQSDDGVRLWVNDQLLIDNWTDHRLTENSGTISLVAGQTYNIKMEYYENTIDATAKLLWSSASTPKAVIPQSQLFSNSGDGLQVTYYDNLDFTGSSITQVDSIMYHNWGQSGPASGIEADTFSARWTGQVQAQYSELYTFYTQSDDGVRLWVNDQLLIDNWTEHALTENSATISLVAGQKYNIRMEFYDNRGGATAQLLWSSPSTSKAVISQAQLYSNSGDGLQATYYDNLDFTGSSSGDGLQAVYYDDLNFTGAAVSQVNPTVNYNWGLRGPAPGIGADTFSARWTGQVRAQYSEDYTFYTQSDDGVRLWVNDQLLIDNWTEHAPTENTGTIALQAGQKYNIRMEFYDNIGSATANLLWSSASIAKSVIPQDQLFTNPVQNSKPIQSQPGDGLQAAYYNYSDFTGASVTRIDPTVNFNWGLGSPDPGIKSETFSARWTGQVQALHSEDYTFYTQSDDGVRLWVNDQLLIDNWTNHKLTENSGTINLKAGQKYNLKMEFYDNIGSATAKLLWSSASTAKAVIPQSQLFSNSEDSLLAASSNNLNLAGNTALAKSAISSSSNEGQTDVLLGNQVAKANNIQPMSDTSLAQSEALTAERDLTWSIGSRGVSGSGSQTDILSSSPATGLTDLLSMNGTASNYSAGTLPVLDPNWQVGV